MIHVNEITLNYKRRTLDLGKINCSQDAFKVATSIYQKSHANLDLKEFFFVIFLNRANEILGYKKVAEGGVNSVTVDARLIFAPALKALSSGVILIHNHPSGGLEPSYADRALTKDLKEAGRLLQIKVLDHLIVTSEGYYSFADDGLL
jgi:DNA repair protein RadC